MFAGLWPLLSVNIVFQSSIRFLYFYHHKRLYHFQQLSLSFFKQGWINIQTLLFDFNTFLVNFIHITFNAFVLLIFKTFYFLHSVVSSTYFLINICHNFFYLFLKSHIHKSCAISSDKIFFSKIHVCQQDQSML